MKFFISVDMEGVGTVASSFGMKKDDACYRERITMEVNAVVEGILKACKSPKEILVCDSHNEGENILPYKLNERVSLVRGYPRATYMMTGIDSSFDLVFLLGYHAMTGTQGAILDHTFSGQRVQRVEINGREVGEFDLSAGLAAHYKVPVGFISGDDKFEKQVKKVAPWIKTAIVKFGMGRNAAKVFHPAKVDEILKKRAFEASRDLKKMKLLKFTNPVRAYVDFSKTVMADQICLIPSIKRISGKRIFIETKDFKDFYDLFAAAVSLAHGVD